MVHHIRKNTLSEHYYSQRALLLVGVRARACASWRYAGVQRRARTPTSAKLPVGSISTPMGTLNLALVPTSLLMNPAEVLPATVVTTPEITGADGGGDGEGGGGDGDGGGEKTAGAGGVARTKKAKSMG